MSDIHIYTSFHLWALPRPHDAEWLGLMKKITVLMARWIKGGKVLTLCTKVFNTNS